MINQRLFQSEILGDLNIDATMKQIVKEGSIKHSLRNLVRTTREFQSLTTWNYVDHAEFIRNAK